MKITQKLLPVMSFSNLCVTGVFRFADSGETVYMKVSSSHRDAFNAVAFKSGLLQTISDATLVIKQNAELIVSDAK